MRDILRRFKSCLKWLQKQEVIERAFTRRGKLKETKTGVTSWKALSSSLYARLQATVRDKLPDAWLFTNSRGGPFTTNLASEIWRNAAREAGVNVCLYVSIRHSRVSQKRRDLERKMADQMRQELDHARFETTRKHYARDERDAFRKGGNGTDAAPTSEADE